MICVGDTNPAIIALFIPAAASKLLCDTRVLLFAVLLLSVLLC